MISQHLCTQWLGTVRQQAITWANVEPDLCHYMISLGHTELTHWGRLTHICVSKLTIIGSDNDLLPDRRQAIIWTNAGILIIRTLGTNFSEFLSEINTFSLKKMHLKMLSGKWRPSCLGLNVLILWSFTCIKIVLPYLWNVCLSSARTMLTNMLEIFQLIGA